MEVQDRPGPGITLRLDEERGAAGHSVGVRRTPAGTGNVAMNAAKPARIRSVGTGPDGCGALRSIASSACRWSLLMWPPGKFE